MAQFCRSDQPLTESVIGAAIAVHRALGPGLLESVYDACLTYELEASGLRVERQRGFPVRYREVILDAGYRADLVVEDSLIVEVKAVEQILPVHEAQVLTYLRVSGLRTGLLLNFGAATLREGIRRYLLDAS